MVHLTWAGSPQAAPEWPHTTRFTTLDHWVREILTRDAWPQSDRPTAI
jgi:hypothetical protein